ncbi:MarR family winged helix-turn-helix transcriptional regulator [Bacillus sp. REN16]|uniref:MarR family winged helix-turn-helix transcriptional regulator n=1 Tax=Bacillus sp. REN16 TaxID=2887296 RepID=UPI001E48526A|nr:MarR family transcriptional regulator [Bacillus sp. REN16]MCC3356302.1 MarR family transcriptional regulator [Bacillus sp. REN16]
MDQKLDKLDLLDSISERHNQLRKLSEELWNNHSDIAISNSEWYIMSRIYKKQPTIAYVSKNVDITRQATHKFIKGLKSKGLVDVMNVENNKKVKSIQLTPLGEECYEKNEALKAKIEKQLAEKIGEEQIELLKSVLKMEWGI